MTLDELIATLNKIKDEHGGDLPVKYPYLDEWEYDFYEIYPSVKDGELIL